MGSSFGRAHRKLGGCDWSLSKTMEIRSQADMFGPRPFNGGWRVLFEKSSCQERSFPTSDDGGRLSHSVLSDLSPQSPLCRALLLKSFFLWLIQGKISECPQGTCLPST